MHYKGQTSAKKNTCSPHGANSQDWETTRTLQGANISQEEHVFTTRGKHDREQTHALQGANISQEEHVFTTRGKQRGPRANTCTTRGKHQPRRTRVHHKGANNQEKQNTFNTRPNTRSPHFENINPMIQTDNLSNQKEWRQGIYRMHFRFVLVWFFFRGPLLSFFFFFILHLLLLLLLSPAPRPLSFCCCSCSDKVMRSPQWRKWPQAVPSVAPYYGIICMHIPDYTHASLNNDWINVCFKRTFVCSL